MFIELHLIQNFVPANLNRDDTNNPKDCIFGGHRRARISSQSFKRAIRMEPVFANTTQVKNGERSKWAIRPLRKQLMEAGKTEEEATAVARNFLAKYYSKMDKNPDKTAVLIYFSQEEIEQMAQGLLENWEDAVTSTKKNNTVDTLVKALEKQTKGRTSAPDIALFGRMLAQTPTLNIDAACQVAHAISTHSISMEMDFFSAVDELQDSEQEEGAGAGMIGFTPFNSACYYRYARIHWDQLLKNLDKNVSLTRRTVEGFLRAAVDAIPTGKQNSFAAQNPTSLAMAVVREDGRSWNLANAFETPVKAKLYAQNQTGLIQPSIDNLDTFWGQLTRARDDARFESIAVHTVKFADRLNTLQAHHTPAMSEWINTTLNALPQE